MSQNCSKPQCISVWQAFWPSEQTLCRITFHSFCSCLLKYVSISFAHLQICCKTLRTTMSLYNPFRFSSDESLYLAPQIPLTLSISAASAEKEVPNYDAATTMCHLVDHLFRFMCTVSFWSHFFICLLRALYDFWETACRTHYGFLSTMFFVSCHAPSITRYLEYPINSYQVKKFPHLSC